jgi:CheY-like chemotaxis protein
VAAIAAMFLHPLTPEVILRARHSDRESKSVCCRINRALRRQVGETLTGLCGSYHLSPSGRFWEIINQSEELTWGAVASLSQRGRRMNPMSDPKTILVVEDDENDLFLLQRAFHAVHYTGTIEARACVEGAVEYLQRFGGSHGRSAGTAPEILITDLKLTGLSGFDLLKWLKENPDFRVTTTVVLSSSDVERDVTKAYDLGANAYMVKPCEQESLRDILDTLIDFWRICRESDLLTASPCSRSPTCAERCSSGRLREALTGLSRLRHLECVAGCISARHVACAAYPSFRGACG